MAFSLRASVSRPLFRASVVRTSPLRGGIQPFHSTVAVQKASKDQNASTEEQKQDHRSTLKPNRSEYTMSGHDGEVAEKWDAAFNPKNTRPEEEFAKAGNGDNVLEASGANRDMSKSTDEKGQQKEERKTKSSESNPSRKHGKYLPSEGDKPTMNK